MLLCSKGENIFPEINMLPMCIFVVTMHVVQISRNKYVVHVQIGIPIYIGIPMQIMYTHANHVQIGIPMQIGIPI